MIKTTFKIPAFYKKGSYLITLLSILFLSSCKKEDDGINFIKNPSYSAEVLDKWITLQLRLMRNATGIPNQGFGRHVAYTGIAAVESLKPGFTSVILWSEKWNGLSGLPASGQKKDYYYPANVNAAMAAINRSLFPNATAGDKNAIDSLESVLNSTFLATQDQSILDISASFGKAVAAAVFNWSETDGYKLASSPYTPPTGPGMWVPTAPAFANASTPYLGNNRPIISGSTSGIQVPPMLTYSTNPGSPFYQMVKQVYDVSQTLTDKQKAMALFWKDVPGATSPGHWLSIMQQAVRKNETSLDKAALAYALVGAAVNDALISCFKAKYQHNVVRPITYIRDVMGHNTWSPFLTTPPHPEYVSAHSSLSGAAALVMQKLFGNPGSFTDHTYDYLGFAPRTYPSYISIADEAGLSRLYAGIHYQPSITAGLIMGKQIAENMFKD